MDYVTVLGPLWLLFYAFLGFVFVLFFFKVKLFNLEKVQGRKRSGDWLLLLVRRWLLNFL